jgi:hypothetical protein
VPGNYISFFSQGLTSGSPGTYAQDPALVGEWTFDAYSVATPTPTTAPTITPVPTMTPTMLPTATPTTTPTPTMYSIYVGSFSVNGFSGSSPAPYTVPAQSGCFFVVLNQPVGGSIAQYRGRPNAASTPNANDNTETEGFPNLSGTTDYNETNIAYGSVTQFNMSNLSVSKQTGSGTFTLDSGATGTVTIQSASNETFALPAWVRQALAREAKMRARAYAHRR